MDAPGLDPAEVADAYRVLSKINRQFFGGRRVLRAEIRRLIEEDRPNRVLTLLDVGSGSGDLPSDMAGPSIRAFALDRDPTAARLAHDSALDVVLGDALRLPMADRSIDVATAVKFGHHFSGDPLRILLSEMARVARSRVLVLDIRRDWLAYAGFIAWSHVFTRNRLVRHDGALSVLRGFTGDELIGAARESILLSGRSGDTRDFSWLWWDVAGGLQWADDNLRSRHLRRRPRRRLARAPVGEGRRRRRPYRSREISQG